MLIPLCIIMTISALKALFEDYKRHKSDNEENNKNTFVFRGSGFHFEHWKNIQVGDIIKVTKIHFFISLINLKGHEKSAFTMRYNSVVFQ